MAAGGGRLAPPASKSHNFQVWLCASFLVITERCISQSATRKSKPEWPPIVQAETWWKKQKVPTLPQKSRKNLKSSEKNEIHAVGYSTCQQFEKNNKKNLGSNEGDFRCVPKKTNNAKKCAMKFRNIKYLNGALTSQVIVAIPNQQSVSKSVQK